MVIVQTISISEIRSQFPAIKRKIAKQKEMTPVLSNNKIEFYILNAQQAEEYIKLQKMQNIKEEVSYAKKFDKRYTNGKDLINDIVR